MNDLCKICQNLTVIFDEAVFRRKYAARFLRCNACGLMSVENPHWLAEAYAEPINRSDTGYVWRNLWCRDKVTSLIEASRLNGDGTFLDYAAGYGLFVRLMRDNGYDFRWHDPYCQNLFSRGFEVSLPLTGPFEAVTAFEVFEHLTNPMEDIQIIAPLTPVITFSTTLLPDPTPRAGHWWYYGLEHGQHITFYTRKSLEHLGGKFGYQFTTNGSDFHVFSRKPVSFGHGSQRRILRRLFQFITNSPSKLKRPTLTQSDHDLIAKRLQEKNCQK